MLALLRLMGQGVWFALLRLMGQRVWFSLLRLMGQGVWFGVEVSSVSPFLCNPVLCCSSVHGSR